MTSERTPADAGPWGGITIIGLTGPIGCGKTTVAAMLARLGGTVVDADALTREVMAPGQPALEAIRTRFGDAVFESRTLFVFTILDGRKHGVIIVYVPGVFEYLNEFPQNIRFILRLQRRLYDFL